MDINECGFNSKLVHGGDHRDEWGSPITPIYQTSTFAFKDADHGARLFAGEEKGYIYTRLGNPTVADLERTVADLEGGYGGIACSSGMGAVNVVYLTYLQAGMHAVCHESLYGPSRVVLETIFKKFGVESTFVDTTNIDNVKRAIRQNTQLIYLETPSNPTMGICDIELIAHIATKNNIKLCVDNTFCSPYLQRPLELGADVVLHSITKFINGHADIVGGIIVAANEKDYLQLAGTMKNIGCNMDPHQAFLTRRGLKTLALRIDKSQQSAMKVAQFLEEHPKVKSVAYPGLRSHPQYELAKKQMDGPGTMISFELNGGIEAGKTMMNNVKLAILAVSLGGIETLIQHPASMTHSKMTPESRKTAGITDGLVRLSVGIEEVEDIIGDLAQALDKI